VPEARRLLLWSAGLYPPASLRAPDGIALALHNLGSVQVDPLNRCGRNHDLVLAARVDGYRLDDWQSVVHGPCPREFVEYYDKALCIVRASDLPLHRHKVLGSSDYHRRRLKFLQDNKEAADRILCEIQERGPLCSLDIEGEDRINWWWGKSRLIKAVLDVLFTESTLLVHHRQGTRRYYDLPERLVRPQHLADREITPEDMLLNRVGAIGLLDITSPQASWDLGPKKELRLAAGRLVDQGVLVRIRWDGGKRELFGLAESVRAWEESATTAHEPRISLLAPLDNLLWDRRLLSELFGFDYSWEVYLPVNKRKFGYYVLPVLYGEGFVGRAEPVMDFKTRKLFVKGLWWEQGFKPDRKFKDAWARTMAGFRDFLSAEKVEGERV